MVRRGSNSRIWPGDNVLHRRAVLLRNEKIVQLPVPPTIKNVLLPNYVDVYRRTSLVAYCFCSPEMYLLPKEIQIDKVRTISPDLLFPPAPAVPVGALPLHRTNVGQTRWPRLGIDISPPYLNRHKQHKGPPALRFPRL